MTTQALTLELETRSVVGKKVQTLRRQGITPVHLYGKGASSMSLQADASTILRIVAQAGRNRPVSVSISGQETPYLAFIREVQRHPVSEAILHVDFYQVPITEVAQANVPIRLIGEAPAIRMQNGVLNQVLPTLRVECLPLDVPEYFELDMSGLDDFEKALHVSDIPTSDKVTFLNSPNDVIARVNAPRVAVEEVAAIAETGEGEATVATEGASQEQGSPES